MNEKRGEREGAKGVGDVYKAITIQVELRIKKLVCAIGTLVKNFDYRENTKNLYLGNSGSLTKNLKLNFKDHKEI